jgi:hypothetical protein
MSSAPIQDDTATSENETGAYRGKHTTKEDNENGRQCPRSLHGNNPQRYLHDEDAYQKKGQPEDGNTAAPATNFQSCLIPVDKRAFLRADGGLVKNIHFKRTA